MNINYIICPGCQNEVPMSLGRGMSLWDRMRLRFRTVSKPEGSYVWGPCWEWMGGYSGTGGFRYGAVQDRGKILKVHRVMHEMFVGHIPDDHFIDHLCANPRCAAVNHIEAVTPQENVARRDHHGYVSPSFEQRIDPDLRASFDIPDGLPYVVCPHCRYEIPGAPSAHLPLEDRVRLRLKPSPAPEGLEGDCWLWTGSNTNGYGHLSINNKLLKAHRVAYELWKSPISEGLDIDHLCRVHECCNPSHLEPVNHRENVLRGASLLAEFAKQTHCKRGHEFTPGNTIERKEGGRKCRTCHNLRSLAYLRGEGAEILDRQPLTHK